MAGLSVDAAAGGAGRRAAEDGRFALFIAANGGGVGVDVVGPIETRAGAELAARFGANDELGGCFGFGDWDIGRDGVVDAVREEAYPS